MNTGDTQMNNEDAPTAVRGPLRSSFGQSAKKVQSLKILIENRTRPPRILSDQNQKRNQHIPAITVNHGEKTLYWLYSKYVLLPPG